MNISLKDLVELIDINYEKYNQNEKSIVDDIMISLSEKNMLDLLKEMYLYEFKNLLDKLNSLLDKDDLASAIDRGRIDEKMLQLRDLIDGFVDEEKSDNDLVVEGGSVDRTDNTEKNRIRIEKGILIVSSLALLAALFATGYVIVKDAKNNKDKDNSNDGKDRSISGTIEEKDGSDIYDYSGNVVNVEDDKLVLVEDKDDGEKLASIEEVQEPLTTENFNNLVGAIEEKFAEKNLAVSKENTRKFAMILNIDKLAQDNKELINEIIGSQNTEEVFADADKVISTIMTYNYEYYYNDEDAIIEAYLANKAYKHDVDGFVKISDFVYDNEQKEIVMEIESRIGEIGESVEDNAKMNELIHTLLKDMIGATSKLSMLEDGVNYAVEWVYIELLRGMFGMDLDGKSTLDATNNDLVKYYVSYVEDEKSYYDNSSVNGSVRNINNLLNDCKEKTLTK